MTIATDPSYTSLNLAQAIAVMCHELWVAAGGDGRPVKLPRRRSRPADMASHELLFADWRRALWAIDFFKTRQEANVLRGLREILFRASLDERELKLLRAMGLETVRYLERAGLSPSRPPGEDASHLGRPSVGEPSVQAGVDLQEPSETP